MSEFNIFKCIFLALFGLMGGIYTYLGVKICVSILKDLQTWIQLFGFIGGAFLFLMGVSSIGIFIMVFRTREED